MSRVIVLEVHDDSNLTMRDIYHKVKELDDRIRVICSMSFDNWIELNGYHKEENIVDGLPLFPCYEDGHKPTEEELDKLAKFVYLSQITPMEKYDEMLKEFEVKS